jgi:hypothetical protein
VDAARTTEAVSTPGELPIGWNLLIAVYTAQVAAERSGRRFARLMDTSAQLSEDASALRAESRQVLRRVRRGC